MLKKFSSTWISTFYLLYCLSLSNSKFSDSFYNFARKQLGLKSYGAIGTLHLASFCSCKINWRKKRFGVVSKYKTKTLAILKVGSSFEVNCRWFTDLSVRRMTVDVAGFIVDVIFLKLVVG